MGVRRLFSRGGQKFSRGGGARTYFLPKKVTKNILFFPKKAKNILFFADLGRKEGARAPLPPPCGRPCLSLKSLRHYTSIIDDPLLTNSFSTKTKQGTLLYIQQLSIKAKAKSAQPFCSNLLFGISEK
jgi:hypothetical protein